MKGGRDLYNQRRPFGGRRKKPCHCTQPVKEVVYPVQNNVVHKCSEETVQHIHPIHTTVMNHHLIKNEHLYPQTTSVENIYEEVDVSGSGPGAGMGPGIGGPGQGPNQVAGAMVPGAGFGPNKFQGKSCHNKGRYKR